MTPRAAGFLRSVGSAFLVLQRKLRLCAVGLLTHRAGIGDFGPLAQAARRVRRPAALSCVVVLGAGLAAAALGAEPAPSPTLDQVKQSREQLMHAAVEAPPQAKPSADLSAAVEKIQSLRVAPKSTKSNPDSYPPAVPDEKEAAKPNVETLLKELVVRTEDPKADAAALIAQLKDVPADKVADPAAVADTLFRGGHLDEACRFYEKALTKDTPTETKAWTLFQMANCRRMKDPAAAQALYHRVQTEHAASMWAATAALEERLLQWLQTVSPAEPAGKPAKPVKSPSE